jgi:nicotinate phosphoribosyltransferase
MTEIKDLYGSSLALLTDLYQLTMSYGYWKTGTTSKEAAYHLFFRRPPFHGGFAIAAGLEYVIEFIERFQVTAEDAEYLASLKGHDDNPLFERAFVDYLKELKFTCDVDAVPEGTVVFPQEPLIRIRGPILQCQILETALLNIVNFQTLIATKAARIKESAGDRPVVEFGLRRAHGFDGAITASRASYIGGADATSNVLAGRLFGIPVRGTHAHSWVMSFHNEKEAFAEYAKALPNNCVFLVDTYDTVQGVQHAIEVGRWLHDNGHELIGVRLDSGDLAYLSIQAREMLDKAGFPSAQIMASNDLDEHIISSLNQQGARIDSFGVGTKLVTAYDQPALGGVYKLGAVRFPGGEWEYKLKLSEQQIKISNPGILQVRRFSIDGTNTADAIFDCETGIEGDVIIVDPIDVTRRKIVPRATPGRDLLIPIFRDGKLQYKTPSLNEIKAHCQKELSGFHPTIKRILNPHLYPAGLEQRLHDLKMALVLEARGIPVQ